MRKVFIGLGGILALLMGLFVAPAAQAATGHGPAREYCTVHGNTVAFDFWWDSYNSPPTSYVPTRFKWNTGGFTPSRIVLSIGGPNPVPYATYGGSASTLHDVASAYDDTSPGDGTSLSPASQYTSIYARVYLNASEWCDSTHQPLF